MGTSARTVTPVWACCGTIAQDRRVANAAVPATAPRSTRRRLVVGMLMIAIPLAGPGPSIYSDNCLVSGPGLWGLRLRRGGRRRVVSRRPLRTGVRGARAGRQDMHRSARGGFGANPNSQPEMILLRLRSAFRGSWLCGLRRCRLHGEYPPRLAAHPRLRSRRRRRHGHPRPSGGRADRRPENCMQMMP